jgi:hypothetical protein
MLETGALNVLSTDGLLICSMTRFFVFDYLVGSPDETEFEEIAPVRLGDAPRCPTCGLFVGGLPWLPPYRALVRAHGEQLGDVAFGVGDSLLVSDRFRRAWEAEGLRGLSRFDALEELRVRPAKLAKSAVSYFHVSVEYGRTEVDEERSIIERSEPPSCGQCKTGGTDSIRGFAIAEGTWSGEDIFYAWGLPGTTVVTERLKQLAERYALTNIHLTPVEDYVRDPLRKHTGAS